MKYTYERISEEEYQHALGQWRLNAGTILGQLFAQYGQDAYIPVAIKSLQHITEQFGMRIRGKAQPITLPEEMRYLDRYNADD